MGFKSVKRVEVKAETTTPGELRTITDANGTRIGSSRARRMLPKLEFLIDEDGAVVHGPPRAASYPFFVSNENGNNTVDFPVMPLQQHADHFQHPNQHQHPLFRSRQFVDESAFSANDQVPPSTTEAASISTNAENEPQRGWTSTSAGPSPNQMLMEEELIESEFHGDDHGENELKSAAAALSSSSPSASTVGVLHPCSGSGSRMKECVLNDTRASSLAVKFDKTIGKFVCGSSIERFSGHTGVCRVLGSKKYPITPHSLHLGDLIRIGSVGLVVREINRTASDTTAEVLSDEELQQLREQYLSLPLQQPNSTDGTAAQTTEGEDADGEAQPNESGDDIDNDNNHQQDEQPLHSCGGGAPISASSEEEDENNGNQQNHKHRRHHSNSTNKMGTETSDEERESDGHGAHCCCDVDGEEHDASDCCCVCTTSTCNLKNLATPSTMSRRVCYICYDGDEDPTENPLVAPCNCKGDTKYVHLNCLQRWNHNLDVDGSNPNLKVCAVTNTDGLDVCTICKATYRTKVQLEDGRIISLLAKKLPPPYVTFAVVTQHETRNRSTVLTNTQFQLSFANLPKNMTCLTIGRSTSNNMTLRYRTVSQLHAKIRLQDEQFFLTDAASSNGTMLFLHRPLALDWNKAVFVKIGRTILTLRAKRRWKWSADGHDEDCDTVTFPFAAYPPFHLPNDHTEVHGATSGNDHESASTTPLRDPTADLLPFGGRIPAQFVDPTHSQSNARVFLMRRVSSDTSSYATYLSTNHQRRADTSNTSPAVRVASEPHTLAAAMATPPSSGNAFTQRLVRTPRASVSTDAASMASLTSQLAGELRMTEQ